MFTKQYRITTTLLLLQASKMNVLFSAQTTCNQGMGRVMYERLPNQQLHGFDDDVVSILSVVSNLIVST